MICRLLKISQLAVFQDFDWNIKLRDKGNNIVKFNKLNILYGRNYSGKTTLSRIFQFLENKEVDNKYLNAKFEIEIEESENVTQANITSNNLDVRVYNSDFIKKNLKFLQDDENGSIESFAILGEENLKIEKEIKVNERIIKGDKDLTGLESLSLKTYEKFNNKGKERGDLELKIENKLRIKANQDIKLKDNIYGDRFYDISKIKIDIKSLEENKRSSLSEEEIEARKKLINEKAKDTPQEINATLPNLFNLFQDVNEFLIKKVIPNIPLNDLLKDSTLQSWVEEGVSHHKNKRETCAFCGQQLPKELWQKLENHFNKESDELKLAIKNKITETEEYKIDFHDAIKLKKEDFYHEFQGDFEKLVHELEGEFETFNQNVKYFAEKLKIRLKDIFKSQNTVLICDNKIEIERKIEKINTLIQKQKVKTEKLDSQKNEAKKDLRLNEVKKFLEEIEYESEVQKVKEIIEEENVIKKYYDFLERELKNINHKIDDLRAELKDEEKAAKKINEYIHHFFGNPTLQLIPLEDRETGKKQFQILRNSEVAFNLSEGECSLIAFCYFMAKLEDEKSKGRELIIWIDDPISSLDNNNIFFIFSLIESVITKPNNYKQLFISTHNLDLLKYLKRLTIPRKKITATDHNGMQTPREIEDVGYFLVERRDEKNSDFSCMPNYLKNYVTEFNYLFDQIYKCSITLPSDENHHIFYNFGNNLRKFLEGYLFYKYPTQENNIIKIQKFFGDLASTTIANRISNELSHLEGIFDRSMKPVEIPEMQKLAKYVLDKIKTKDPDQYYSLLKSINVKEDATIEVSNIRLLGTRPETLNHKAKADSF